MDKAGRSKFTVIQNTLHWCAVYQLLEGIFTRIEVVYTLSNDLDLRG